MRAVLGLACAALALTLQGCIALGCTAVGGASGIDVTIGGRFDDGSLDLRLCDEDGCESAIEQLARPGKQVEPPPERWVHVSWRDLGRRLAPGPVKATLVLRDPDGRLVARREQTATVRQMWPNGKACDGDEFIYASLTMRVADRIAAP